MEKRIALLQDGVVFNIIVGSSAEEMATLFNCEAVEVTPDTLQAHIGYGFTNGVFDSPPVEPDPIPEEIVEEEIVEEEN
jgi:hypothetical protein